MHSLALLGSYPLGALPAQPGLDDLFDHHLNGLLLVVIALGLVWAATTLVGVYFTRKAAHEPPVPTTVASLVVADNVPVPAPATESAPPANELPPELIAVIATAVQLSLRGSFRIQAIVPVVAGHDWASEGRRQIFASHQIR